MSADVDSLTRDELSQSDLRLIEIMSRVHFGKIDSFPVRNGEPVLDPEPEIELREMIGARRARTPDIWVGKYLNPKFSDAIRNIKRMRNGRVTCIQMQDGLPFMISKRPASK